MENQKNELENSDFVVYNTETKEIIAIVPIIAGKRDAVFKKGYSSVIKDCNEKFIVGDGKHIYLAEEE